MKMVTTFNVIKIKNGVVDEITISTTDPEKAEKEFLRCARVFGAKNDDTFLLDEGYFEICNASVCLTSIDVEI